MTSTSNPEAMAKCYAQGWAASPNFMTRQEAQAVTSLNQVFKGDTKLTSFDEFKYFTGVTALGGQEFYNCTNLVSITIPSSITSITQNGTLSRCNKLRTITWNSTSALIGHTRPSSFVTEYKTENPNLASVNGCLYSADRTILYGVPSSHTSYTWLGTETEIKEQAFYGSKYEGAMIFPSTVAVVGAALFDGGSDKITSLDLSNSQITVLPCIMKPATGALLSSYILPSGLIKTTGGDPINGVTKTQVRSLTFPATLERVEGGNWFSNGYTSLTFLGTTPPYLAAYPSAGSLTAIYVPAASVNTYKAARGFSLIASIIQAIP